MAMPERIWATPLGEPDGGFWYSPCADKTDKTEYVLATTNQRTLEALGEAEKALEQARLYIERDEAAHGRQFGDGNAVRAALARIKEATDGR